MKIILASASPRRQSLLQQAGIPFETLPVDADESADKHWTAQETVQILSRRKAAQALTRINEPALIIAADTLVSVDDKILGKPSDAGEAFDMLVLLRGRRHTVYTGVTMKQTLHRGAPLCFFDAADVYMRALTDGEIRAYIATGEPFDKAGAYGVQEKGAMWIERIDGDYHTVVGLPLAKLYAALLTFGADITDFWNNPC